MAKTDDGRWPVTALTVILALSASGIIPCFAAGDGPGLYLEHLPVTPLFCPLAGDERRLTEALSGRPVVVFLTDAEQGYDNPLGATLSDCQGEFGPWLSWVGVMVGQASRGQIEKMRRDSPLSLEHCFQDVEGLWWRDLAVGPLPAVVLANEDGYILDRFSGAESRQDHLRLTAALEQTVKAATLKGKSARDFRLPDPATGEFRSLFDVSGPDYTTLLFLHTSCDDCLRELRVLERIRNRYRDRTSLVAVFHDHPGEGSVRTFLDTQAISPDFVLSDPEMLYSGRYFFNSVPVLLLIGPDGKIIFSRKGYRSEDAMELAATLDTIFFDSSPPSVSTSFGRARQISSDGMEYFSQGDYDMASLYWERSLEIFPGAESVRLLLADAYRLLGRRRDSARQYGLYLASGAGGYDLSEVKERLRELSGSTR